MSDSILEARIAHQIRLIGLPAPKAEYRFYPDRKWQFDFAWPEHNIALEVEGGIFMKKGGHTSGKGYEADCEKYSVAAVMGWTVLRVTSNMIDNGRAITLIEYAFRKDEIEHDAIKRFVSTFSCGFSTRLNQMENPRKPARRRNARAGGEKVRARKSSGVPGRPRRSRKIRSGTGR